MPVAQKSGASPSSEPITSRDNRWIKRFRSALRDGEIENDIVGLEGPHLIEEALRAGLETQTVLYSPSGESHLLGLRRLLPSQVQVLRTTDKLFEALADTRAPQGIAALAKIRRASFDDVLSAAGQSPLVVLLAAVQDPGNVGTVIRAAEGFAASGAIIATGSANPWSQKALRASSGSALRLPVLAGISTPVAMTQLRVAGLKLIAASVADGLMPHELNLRQPVALLIGNEGAGLPPETLRSADARVRIPLASNVDSLNAALAAAVLLYEAARQRGSR